MLILIVIILLIILLLLAFTVKSFKLKGGSEIFEKALTQPNENDWEIPNLKPDRYFKSLLYRNFQDYKIRRKKVHGFVPKKIHYIDGGMDVKEFSAIARQRLTISDNSTFEPDFVINIGDDKTLVIEFDENNNYHQDNTVFRYQCKNLIYARLLHSTDRNISIMRITYNSGVNKLSNKENDFRKETTDDLTVESVYKVIVKMIDNEIQNQYVLLRLEADDTSKQLDYYVTSIKEFKGIKAKDNIEFEAPNYSYFQIDLNTKLYYDTGKSCEDNFIITDYFINK